MDANKELIEKYLRGLCSEEEKKEIHRLKLENKDFAKDLGLESLSFAAIAEGERRRQRDQLMRFGEELKKNDQGTIIYFFSQPANLMKVAAVILILVALPFAWNYFNAPPQLTEEQLFAELITTVTPEDKIIDRATRGANDADSLVDIISILQAEGKCDEVLSNTRELVNIQGKKQELLYSGICFLDHGNPNEAIEILDELKDINIIRDQYLWYSALAHLKAGQSENARDRFCDMQTEGHTYRSDEVALALKNLDAKCSNLK